MTRTHRRVALAVVLAVLAALVLLAVRPDTAKGAVTNESVGYRAHVASEGWQTWRYDGATAGTTGLNRRVEAFQVSGIDLTYRAHVAGKGWLPWVQEGQTAGTTGEARRVEAFQIVSENPEWGIEYRAHVASIGWQPWVHDGALAGTTGLAKQVEAFQIRLVEKNVPSDRVVTFTATADNGINAAAADLFTEMGHSGANLGLQLGDMSYGQGTEQQFCDQINSRVNFPTEIVSGNHEGDTEHDGYLRNYAKCLPDRLGATIKPGSGYGRNYYLDRGPARFILITPRITVDGEKLTYANGTPEQTWLRDRIRESEVAGQWTIVGFHLPCLTRGVHYCSSTPDLTNLLIKEHVDLVLTGHDHIYARSHQLTGTVSGSLDTNPNTSQVVVEDADSGMARDAGTVFAVVGNGGYNPRGLTGGDARLWAKAVGGSAVGFAKVWVDADSLHYSLINTSGTVASDSFVISMSK